MKALVLFGIVGVVLGQLTEGLTNTDFKTCIYQQTNNKYCIPYLDYEG